MDSYSFLIDTKGITKDHINSLDNYAQTLSSNQTHVEVIAYGVGNIKPINTTRYLQYISTSPSGTTSLQRAVVTAGGKWVIVTTARNFLEQAGKIIQDINNNQQQVAIVPVHLNRLYKRLGVRSLRNTPYVAFQKAYIINLIGAQPTLPSLVRASDKDLKLRLIRSLVAFAHPVIPRLTFFRPYGVIVERSYRHIVWLTKTYFEKRRAERLRKRVLPVPYSKNIPVFIICRDRVEPLKQLVAWLEAEGLKNIFFIDNASTYPPLLEYYNQTPYTVIRLNINAGHTSPWSQGIVQLYAAGKPFIVTDPDIIPAPNAHGAVKLFARLLNDHPERTKAGFGLRIDNLPDHYELKQYVISWEKQFWVSKVEPEVYDAEIDTTFALYRPGTPYTMGPGLRTGGKYVAEHEPWYVNSKHIPSELMYYREHADKVVGSWGVTKEEATDTYSSKLSQQTIQP